MLFAPLAISRFSIAALKSERKLITGQSGLIVY